MKILVIALSGIGDALMFTPALQKIKEDFPQSEIDTLIMYKGVNDIFKHLPQISKIHYHDFLKKGKISSFFFVLGLRKKYDITINVYPSNRKEYNLISFLIGAKKRAAVKYLRKDIRNLGFLNNIRITENDNLHNVEENILLCEKLSGKTANNISPLQINITKDDKKFANEFLLKNKIDKDNIVIGFHPGCATLKNHDKRRWDTKNFSDLSKLLISNLNSKILIFGGNEEKELKSEILKNVFHDNVIEVNTNSILQTAAVMKRCNLFITNDSSLMHIASALKLNVIALIGPTNINYIHPWQTNYKIASINLECSPCFYYSPKPLTCTRTDVKFKCIKELNVEYVYKIARSFI